MRVLSHSRGLFGPLLDCAAGWAHLLNMSRHVPSTERERLPWLFDPQERTDPIEQPTPRPLLHLMAELALDPSTIRDEQPSVMRGLERTCAKCPHQDRCERDLKHGSLRATYAEFCPNTHRFDVLLGRAKLSR